MSTNAMLHASDVRAGYHGCEVLHGISFDLRAGEVLGVIGPNGSGKSTLLRAVTGLLPLLGGHVLIGGNPLSKIGARERARLCAVQPQVESPVFDYTVEEFVLLGRHPHRALLGSASADDREKTTRALARTDLSTLTRRSIRSLSTGEWQRALLARALAQDTPILMLDEPAAHLDPGHRHAMHRLMRDIARAEQRAILCVSHDLNLAAEFCDQLVLLCAGHIRASGAPADVLRETTLQEVFSCPSLRVAANPFTGRPGTFFAP